jgi:hypothetical protein
VPPTRLFILTLLAMIAFASACVPMEKHRH